MSDLVYITYIDVFYMAYLIASILPAILRVFTDSEEMKIICCVFMAMLYIIPFLFGSVKLYLNHKKTGKPDDLVYKDPHTQIKHIDSLW